MGNNITARERVSVWKCSRTLIGVQTATYGHLYNPSNILSFKKESDKLEKKIKLGLECLSYLQRLQKHRSMKTVSLVNIKWKEIFECNQRSSVVGEDL